MTAKSEKARERERVREATDLRTARLRRPYSLSNKKLVNRQKNVIIKDGKRNKDWFGRLVTKKIDESSLRNLKVFDEWLRRVIEFHEKLP